MGLAQHLGKSHAQERRLRLKSRRSWPVCVTCSCDVNSEMSSRQPWATFSFDRQCTVSVNWSTEAKFPEPGTPSTPAVDSTVMCEPQDLSRKTVGGNHQAWASSCRAAAGHVYKGAWARPMPDFIVMIPLTPPHSWKGRVYRPTLSQVRRLRLS